MAAAGWSSLPGDLANLVADRLLATNDLDFYMGFRAVCHGWRASTADPRSSPHGDPRFQPRQWVMVDEGRHNGDDDSRLFVNVSTGRFVRRDIRLAIRSHLLVAAAGGWLVLAARRSPQAVRLLNPFTDSLVQYAAPVPPELDLKVSAHVIGSSSPTLLLLSAAGTTRTRTTVYWADPSSKRFVVLKGSFCDSRLASQALAGGLFAGGGLDERLGSLASLIHPTVSKIMGLAKTTPPPFATNDLVPRMTSAKLAWRSCFLVESAGEILIVSILLRGVTRVFKMAAGRNELIEPVRNIGNRAIFIGACRSLSVDADKFASVQANCIYYSKGYYNGKHLSYDVYSLEEGVKEDDGCTFSFSSKACVGVVQLLCRYASYVESSQLGLVRLHRQQYRSHRIAA